MSLCQSVLFLSLNCSCFPGSAPVCPCLFSCSPFPLFLFLFLYNEVCCFHRMSVCCNCAFCNLIGLQYSCSGYKSQSRLATRPSRYAWVWFRQTRGFAGTGLGKRQDRERDKDRDRVGPCSPILICLLQTILMNPVTSTFSLKRAYLKRQQLRNATDLQKQE